MRFAFIVMAIMVCAGCHRLSPKPGPAVPSVGGVFSDDEILATDISFDASTGVITYTLPQDALVRIRIGLINNGPLLSNFIDWEKRTKGPHVETWNLKDHTGKVDFTGRLDMMLVMVCLPLDHEQRANQHENAKSTRKAPHLSVVFPEAKEKSPEGWPIISGVAPIRISLDDKDKDWLTQTKYEVGLFIDYVFLMEDEEGTNPFNYRLNTVNLTNGPHLITANILGYNGDMGTRSIMVYIKN